MFGYTWPTFHAAVNDFPTALLVVGFLFELGYLLSHRESLRAAGFWTILAGTVGAGLAVLSGLQAEDHIAHGEAVHRIIEEHETLALITLGIFAVVAIWRLARERKMGGGERWAAAGLSLVGVVFVVLTGRHGGEMVFDHAAGVPTPVLQQELIERAEGHHHPGGEASEEGVEAQEHDHEHADSGTADSAAPADHAH